MRKRKMAFIAAAFTAALLAGCGNKAEEYTSLAELKTDQYVTLGAYTGYEASAAEPEVTDTYVELYIQSILQNNAEPEEVTGRPVQAGDTVDIEYVGKKDGVAFEGGTGSTDELVIGSGSFIPGFEEGLIGVNAGDTVDLDLTFPESYHVPDLAGQDVVFTITLNGIKAYPELTDELAHSLDETCNTAEDFRKNVYDVLYEREEKNYRDTIEDSLVAQIMEGCTWKKDVPEGLVQEHIDRIRKNLERYASISGVTFDELLLYQFGIEESEFDFNARDGAVDAAKEAVVLQAIANAHDLNPTQEELDAGLEEEARQYGYDSVDEYRKIMGEEYCGSEFRDYQMTRNVMEYVKSNSTIHTLDAGAAESEANGTDTSEEEGTGTEAPEEEGTGTEMPEEEATGAETAEEEAAE